MTVSGMHDSDPRNFINIAMNKIPGGRRLPKVGVLYFYRRCDEFPDIDAAFQTFLDDSLKGSTAEDLDSGLMNEKDDAGSEERLSKKARVDKQKMDAYASVSGMVEFTTKIYEELQRSNKSTERHNKSMEHLKQIKIEMELAKALGEVDRLKELAVEMRKLNELNEL